MKRQKLTHVDSPAAVGRRIHEARAQAGLSQRQLAFPGCTPAYISRIESGERTPSLQLLRELAKRLDVPEEFLATGEQPEEEGPGQRMFEAEVALRFDETDRAQELYQDVLAGPRDDNERAGALAGLGQLAYRLGDMKLARQRLEDALAAYGADVVEHPAIGDSLGRALVSLGELETAIGIFERSLAAAEESQDVAHVLRFSVLLANALIDSSNFGRAEELLGRALAQTEDLADPVVRARLYWSQSRLHTLQTDADAAARYARKALDLLELTEDTHYAARAHQLLAHIELDRGRPKDALELLRQGVDLLANHSNPPERARFRLEEARALAQLGQAEEAAAVAMEAAGVLAETNPVEAGRGYHLLAEAFDQLGDRGRARELYELAAELLERLPNRYLVAVYARLGDLLEAEGDRDAAFEVLRKAVRVQAEAGRTLNAL